MFIEDYRSDSGSHTPNRTTTVNHPKKERPNEALAAANLNEDKKPSTADDYARRSVDGVDPNIASRSGARGIGKGVGDSSIDWKCGVGGSPGAATEGEDRGDGTDRSIQDSYSTRDNAINDGNIQGSTFTNFSTIRGREVRDSTPGSIVDNSILEIRGDSSTISGQVKDGDLQEVSLSGGDGKVKREGVGGRGNGAAGGDNIIIDGDNQDSIFARGESVNANDGTGGKHEDNGSHSSSYSTSKGGDAIANSSNSKGGLALANSISSNGGNSIANSISDDNNSSANGVTSHGGNSTIDSTTGQSSSGDDDDSIVNSNVNGGNSTIVNNVGNSITGGQVSGNNSEGDQGSSGNDSIMDGDSGVSIHS